MGKMADASKGGFAALQPNYQALGKMKREMTDMRQDSTAMLQRLRDVRMELLLLASGL